jgi:co-chaperonin GroES (HSP10)
MGVTRGKRVHDAAIPRRCHTHSKRENSEMDCFACGRAPAAIARAFAEGGNCAACARKMQMPGDPHMVALIAPLHGYVAVIPDEPSKRSGLIIIPRTARDENGQLKEDKTFAGRVAAVGPGWLFTEKSRERRHIDCAIGDHVLVLAKHEKSIVRWRGLAIVGVYSILAVLEDERQSA